MSALRLSSDGTGRILDRLKNLSEHYVHTEPFNRTIWLVYGTGTNARGFWLVKRMLGWKIFMPENFLEINRYFALTSYCNTIGQSNNAFSILGFSWRENEENMFWSSHPLADKANNEHLPKPFFKVIRKSIHFRFVYAEIWTVRRLNLCTVKVAPFQGNC